MSPRRGLIIVESVTVRKLKVSLPACTILASLLCLAPAAGQAPRLSVLFVGAFAPRSFEFEPYRRELTTRGIESVSIPQRGSDYSQPTLECLKDFDVVAVIGNQAWDRAAEQREVRLVDACSGRALARQRPSRESRRTPRCLDF